MATRIRHVEVTGRDGLALQRFYAELFDWTINNDNPTKYGFVSPDEAGIDVGIGTTHDGSGGFVTYYAAVSDIDATLAKVAKLGGTTVMPKFSPGGGATLALFADPEGHVIGLTEV